MFLLYLRRELGKRKRQTAVVASGLALAIGLAVVVQGASTGVSNAQTQVLQSMYGIGTDVAISKSVSFADGPQRFEIGGRAGEAADGSRTFSRSRLRTSMGADTLTATELEAIGTVTGVARYTGTLKLTSTTFNGELPTFMVQGSAGGQSGDRQLGSSGQGMLAPVPTASASASTDGSQPTAPTGGFDGRGGSAFDITSFSVEGVDPSATDIGTLTAMRLVTGRMFTASPVDSSTALLDQAYATSAKLELGSSVLVGGESLTVVGIIASTATDGSSASSVYIPLDTAQRLSGIDGVTNVSVTVDSAANVGSVTTALEAALPTATVNSASNLADSVTGSLSTATSLVGNLGKWLSILMLLAAFLLAMLLTSAGVQRRTREFGTLKAIGWRSGRIVRQVVGESLVTGVIGGLAGLVVGVVGIAAVNHFAPALTATQATANPFGQGMPGGPGGGRFGAVEPVASATEVTLHAVLTANTVLLALALALAGGILAGAFGGWRAARLSPAVALRSVA